MEQAFEKFKTIIDGQLILPIDDDIPLHPSKFSKEKLESIEKVFYHDQCPDGLASALIVAASRSEAEFPNVEFIPIQYNTAKQQELAPQPHCLFVDITPALSSWEAWKEHAPLVLDHHETAKSVVLGLDGLYGTNDEHSGAMLAFEQFMIPLQGGYSSWRAFAQLCMIRDTWKDKHPHWEEACALSMALRNRDPDELIRSVRAHGTHWTRSDEFCQLVRQGRRSRRDLVATIEKHAQSAYVHTVRILGQNFKCAFFNHTGTMISEVAHKLLHDGCDAAFGFFLTFQDGDMQCVVSIRTTGRFSAAKLAEKFGGGGHAKAAGFRVASAGHGLHDLVTSIWLTMRTIDLSPVVE